jgi:glycosyltransferase 2 family protein
MRPPMIPAPRKRSWRPVLFRLAGSAVALALLFAFLPVGEAWRTVRQISPLLWLLIVAGYLATHLVAASKWRLVVNLGGAGLDVFQGVRCYFAGLFSTLFLPSIVGGDVVRAGLAFRLGRNKAGVLLGAVLDRTVDLVALTCLAGVGVFLVPGALAPGTRHIFFLLAVGCVAVLAIVAFVLLALPARKFSYRMRRRLVRLRQAVHSTARRPHYVFVAFLLSLIVQTGFILLTVRVAVAGHLLLPFRAWLFAWPLAKIFALLPVSQGGIGVREAALAGLLVPFGARAAAVVGVGLVWETVILAGGLVAGLTSFWLGRLAASRTPAEEPSSVPDDQAAVRRP